MEVSTHSIQWAHTTAMECIIQSLLKLSSKILKTISHYHWQILSDKRIFAGQGYRIFQQLLD